MGSHLMHLVIGLDVLPHLPGVDREAFLLGNLAPDASTQKADTHYYTGRHDDLSRRLDLEAYWAESTGENPSYRLGYYCHLVADEIWLQGFYKAWLKQAILQDDSVQAAYYRDFDTYNARLSHRLGLFDFESLGRHVEGDMATLLQKIERDATKTEEGTYHVLSPFQLDAYVDTCVLRCFEMTRAKWGVLV